jgi:hypothetical protein
MRKLHKFVVLLCAVTAAVVFRACESPVSGENGGITGDYASVTFKNTTQFHVEIHQDAFSGSLLCDELLPGASISVNVRPSDNYGVGSTFCYTYRLGLGEKNDAYNILAFANKILTAGTSDWKTTRPN